MNPSLLYFSWSLFTGPVRGARTGCFQLVHSWEL
jgi:hypothetical protein